MFNFRYLAAALIAAAAIAIAGCSALPGVGGGEAAKKKVKPVDDLFMIKKFMPGDLTAVGFMDKTGKVVIDLSPGLEYNGKKYFPNNTKNPPENMLELSPFVGGFAAACFRNPISTGLSAGGWTSTCGFIDKTGKVSIAPKYDRTGYFSEGLAAASNDDNGDQLGGTKWGYIDTTGNMVIPQKYEIARNFADGVVWVKEEVDKNWILIDKTGNQVMPPTNYDAVSDFSEGKAVVRTSSGTTEKHMVIDKTGKVLFEMGDLKFSMVNPKDFCRDQLHYEREEYYDWMRDYPGEYDYSSFNDGILRAENDKMPQAYLNLEGKPAFEIKDMKLTGGGDFSDGYAVLRSTFADKERLSNQLGSDAVEDLFQCSFVNKKGEVKTVPFMDCGSFHEGLAAVYFVKGDLRGWGFINEKLESAVQPVFVDVAGFEGGLAWVKVREDSQTYPGFAMANWEGYIDPTGKAVVPQW